jgi:putative transposase
MRPQEIRHLIYTTNAVEAYHRQLRKYTKSKAILPTDDSIRKFVFLSVREITKKCLSQSKNVLLAVLKTMPVRDWGMACSQIMIFFADRFAA